MATAMNEMAVYEGAGSGVNLGMSEDLVIDRLWRFAERIAPSKYLDPRIQGDVPTVFHVLCTGQELGLNWTTSLRSIFKDAMRGATILGLLQQKGFKVDFEFAKEPVGSTCTIIRPGDAAGKSRSFSLDDARRIKTEIKDRAKGEWWTLADSWHYINHAEDCCMWRSLVRCARVQAADVVAGLYLPEELDERNSAPASEPTGGVAAEPADEFVVGEKEETIAETEAVFAETIESVTVPAAVQIETAAAPVETPAPAPPKAAAPVVEMPRQQVSMSRQPQTKLERDEYRNYMEYNGPKPAWMDEAVVKYHFYLAHPPKAEGQKHTFERLDKETPQSKLETAELRARAIANERRITCVLVKLAGDEKLAADDQSKIAGIFNPPSADAPATPQPQAAPRDPSIRPATAAAPLNPMTFEVLIQKAVAKIGGAPKEANNILARYFKAYLQEKSVPKDRARLTPPLQKLVEVIEQRIDDLKANPEKLADELAGRGQKTALDADFDLMNWGADLRALARKVMAAAGQTEQAFSEWLQMPIAENCSLASLEPAALEILFNLYLLVGGRCFEVIDFALAQGRSILQTLQEMVTASGKPIDQWDVTWAVKILDTIAGIAKETATPAPPVESSGDWADAGLPFSD